MKLVVMDIDGVLADFEGRLVAALEKKFPKRDMRNFNRHMYSVIDRYEEAPDILEFADQFVKDRHSYHGLEVLPDGQRFAHELAEMDFSILYMTSRPESTQDITLRWLKRNLWRFDLAVGLRVTANKAEDIARMFSPQEIAFIVDDNPDVCKYLGGREYPCIAWRQPWNEDVFPALIPTRDTFYIVENEADSGTEFLAEIKEMI